MGRSQWSAATAWQETALPVPVHAAAIIGESMDEARAKITVMDKKRRMLQRHYTFIFVTKAINFRVAEPAKSLNFLILNRTMAAIFISIFQQLWFTLCWNENHHACHTAPAGWVRRLNSAASTASAVGDFLWRLHLRRLEPGNLLPRQRICKWRHVRLPYRSIKSGPSRCPL